MITSTSSIPISSHLEPPWVLPSRGTIGMVCLIVAEAAIFVIFFIAYIFYIGKSLTGPLPAQVLELPILGTICLLSSSFTVHYAVDALRRDKLRNCTLGLAATVLLGAIFLLTTGLEWYHLIHDAGLTIRTNLFGTTYYSPLVGLHATHVIIGLILLTIALMFCLTRSHHRVSRRTARRSLYSTGTSSDAIWIFVFLVVYVLGR